MKKILSILALAFFFAAGVVGCSSSTTSGTAPGGSPTSPKSPSGASS